MAISVDMADFVGFVLEVLFYGFYVILFFTAVAVLTRYRKEKSTVNWAMLFVTILLFSCCTTHFALEFQDMIQALITEPGVVSLDEETPGLQGADMLFSITDFFAQLVLIYRCWLVYNKNIYVILFPLLITMTAVACAMAGLGMIAMLDPTSTFAPAAIAPLGTASFALTLCLNIIVTGMIIARIWWVARGVRGVLNSKNDYIVTIMAMLVESGALFLAAQLCLVVTFALNNVGQAVIVPLTMQIYGIAPTLIIVRVGLGFTAPQETLVNSTTMKFNTPPATISVRTDALHVTSSDLELDSLHLRTKSEAHDVGVISRGSR